MRRENWFALMPKGEETQVKSNKYAICCAAQRRFAVAASQRDAAASGARLQHQNRGGELTFLKKKEQKTFVYGPWCGLMRRKPLQPETDKVLWFFFQKGTILLAGG
jgi:hypothetical protein